MGLFESGHDTVTLLGTFKDFGQFLRRTLLQGQPQSEYQEAKAVKTLARDLTRSIRD